MKILRILLLTFCHFQLIAAQSMVIDSGASLYVSSGSDICAGTYGNITGNLIGEGTQCGESPLPVELVSFTVDIIGKDVRLLWQTATEINNYGFEVQRVLHSTDMSQRVVNSDQDWDDIGFVSGHGNSNSRNSYSFTDKSPLGGNKFLYRLKQINTDGSYKYLNEVEVEIIPSKYFLYQNYPNPFNPSTKIRYQLNNKSKVLIKIYDVLGAEVTTLLSVEKDPGQYEVEFNAQDLPTGTYVYRIVAGDFTETKKMILLR